MAIDFRQAKSLSVIFLFDLRSKIDATDLLSSSNATRDSSCTHDSPLAAFSVRPSPSKLNFVDFAYARHRSGKLGVLSLNRKGGWLSLLRFLHFCIFAFSDFQKAMPLGLGHWSSELEYSAYKRYVLT
jgi:hypothetical protein